MTKCCRKRSRIKKIRNLFARVKTVKFAAFISAAYSEPNKHGGNNQPQQTFDKEKQEARHAEAFYPFGGAFQLGLNFVFLHFQV